MQFSNFSCSLTVSKGKSSVFKFSKAVISTGCAGSCGSVSRSKVLVDLLVCFWQFHYISILHSSLCKQKWKNGPARAIGPKHDTSNVFAFLQSLFSAQIMMSQCTCEHHTEASECWQRCLWKICQNIPFSSLMRQTLEQFFLFLNNKRQMIHEKRYIAQILQLYPMWNSHHFFTKRNKGAMGDFVVADREKLCEDVLGTMMVATDPLTGQGLSDTELHDQVITLMLAGHEVSRNRTRNIFLWEKGAPLTEKHFPKTPLIVTFSLQTIAVALVWLLYVLATEPEVQEKLRAEISQHLPNQASPISDSVLSKCSYLNAVIKETLRYIYMYNMLLWEQWSFTSQWLLTDSCLFIHLQFSCIFHFQTISASSVDSAIGCEGRQTEGVRHSKEQRHFTGHWGNDASGDILRECQYVQTGAVPWRWDEQQHDRLHAFSHGCTPMSWVQVGFSRDADNHLYPGKAIQVRDDSRSGHQKENVCDNAARSSFAPAGLPSGARVVQQVNGRQPQGLSAARPFHTGGLHMCLDSADLMGIVSLEW